MAEFEIRDLQARIGEKPILQGVNLTIERGETHALMGPNGSGKSTLSNVIMGHPDYEVTGGDILFRGQSLLGLPTEERARLGVFLAFQYPVAVPGVSVARFLKTAVEAVRGKSAGGAGGFLKGVREQMKSLEMTEAFLDRGLNEGFSGGEKKRLEILQMRLLKPALAVLDETDSGLDIDALRIVAGGVNQLRGSDLTLLVITHYERLLKLIQPDHLHVLMEGRIVFSGGPEAVQELERRGYDWLREQAGEAVVAG
ncbi:MAG: Fe-S cluster assembly ATPase SufC [Verrucomicrobia bacterium]|nr:MAG: Fe-S cluster assembly ATPase SufC [Verrucomicrobiota bacterium]